MLCNTAIFYDIENLLGIFSGKANTTLNLDEIYRRVLEMEGVHGVSIQRAYADWALLPNRNLQDSVLQVGIEPIQIFNTNQNDRVKNAADVSLIIDAVELLAKRPEIENYVLASGDGIFAFLSKKLHEHGKRVIGCGFDRNCNITFRNSCDFYISLEKGDKALVATTSPRRKSRKNETVPATQEPATPKPKKVPDKFPKTRFSELLTQADISIWRDTHDTSGSLHVIRKIVETLFSEEIEGVNALEISVFKTYLVHYLPGFKLASYKFSRFGEFMQFVLTGSPYCLYTISESVCKIARRENIDSNGTLLDDIKGLVVTAEDGSRYGSIFSVPEDMPFIYTIVQDPMSAKKHKKTDQSKNGRRGKAALAEVKETVVAEPIAPPAVEEPQPQEPKKRRGRPRKTPPVAIAPPITEAVTVAPPPTPSSPEPKPQEADIAVDANFLRKWIKNQFEVLAADDKLSDSEANLLTTAEYSRKTFGVRTPVLKQIESRSNLVDQRTVNGKVKYWKETFIFNGKHYLVYKDWVASQHKDRFVNWLKSL